MAVDRGAVIEVRASVPHFFSFAGSSCCLSSSTSQQTVRPRFHQHFFVYSCSKYHTTGRKQCRSFTADIETINSSFSEELVGLMSGSEGKIGSAISVHADPPSPPDHNLIPKTTITSISIFSNSLLLTSIPRGHVQWRCNWESLWCWVVKMKPTDICKLPPIVPSCIFPFTSHNGS